MTPQKPPHGILFVADRIMHYHVATMRAIERDLSSQGIPFAIASSKDKPNATGRVALRDKVVANHRHFPLTETSIGTFTFRHQHGVVQISRDVNPLVVMTMCHSGTLSEWLLLHWARRHRRKCVAWQCGYEFNPKWVKRAVLDRFIPLFDFHLCYHTNAQRYAIQHGARRDQTLVMHNTIDESSIMAGDANLSKQSMAAKWPDTTDKKIILYVGAVLPEKRLETVFAALDILANPNLFFLLVGDGPHLRTLRDRYQSRRDWLAVGSIIQGVGEYFDAADVFVLPGTGGLAINEAMAHRLPVISGYADGSADDLVINGETGFRMQAETPKELAEYLSKFADNSHLAKQMGAAGDARIRGPLSFNSFVERAVKSLIDQHELAASSI